MKAEMAVWQMSASEIAARVRTGGLSATDVVTAHLERIEAVNPAVNAVTNVLGEQALCAAAGIDRRRASGEPLGSLAGVPFTVKEDIDVEGSATTFGVPRLRHLVASADARRYGACVPRTRSQSGGPTCLTSASGAPTPPASSMGRRRTRGTWARARAALAVATVWRWRPAWWRSDWATTPAAPSGSRRCSAASLD